MFMERQTTYGWAVVADLFLGGAGAGTFLISFILDVVNRYEAIASIGAIVGPCLVLIGVFFLLADVAIRTRVYRLFCNPRSWTSRGTWILTIFIILGLAYSLSSSKPFMWLSRGDATTVGLAIGIVAALFSVLVLVYSGFLLAVIKPIPFWNTLALPLLFLLSGLCAGIAVLLVIGAFFAMALGQDTITALHTLGIAGIVLVLLQLLVIWAYLEIASHGNVASIESVRLLKESPFIVGIIIIGLVMPLGLLSYGAFVSAVSVISILAVIAGILLLASGFYLRYLVIKIGVYLPRFSI